ncbi:xylulokinase [Gordonia sp. VNK21]|uniref:xylulokinase n=1 Tax=Gordonia sp. VNK21 TaxID=3382483 RepID=UPI0038D4E38F
MTSWTAAVDVGTSAVKALLLDARGEILAKGRSEVPSAYGEQESEDWWSAAIEALWQCGPDVKRVRLLGLTGQMQNLVCMGSDGAALRPAILYSDPRAHGQLTEAHHLLGPGWTHATGNQQDATSLPAKLLWMREHEPESLDRTKQIFLGAAGYLGWRLTGNSCCDLTTASATGLLEADRRQWWSTAVDALALHEALPSLVDGQTVIGTITSHSAREIGLPQGIPVVLAPGDAVSTTTGIVGDELHRGYVYLGTSGWLAIVTPEMPVPAAAHRLLLPEHGRQLVVGAVLSAGAAADWSRRTHLPGMSLNDADRLADTGPSGLLALPSLQGERFPVRDPLIRGALIGITDTTRPDQLYRAMLEGVAFAFDRLLDAVPNNGEPIPVTGGGARSMLWRRVLADVLDRPVFPTETSDEVSAFGAAVSALRAVGDDVPQPLANRGAPEILHPGPDKLDYAKLASAHAALFTALSPTFHSMQ